MSSSDSNGDISKTLKATDVKFGTHLNNIIAVFFVLNSSEGAVYFSNDPRAALKMGPKTRKITVLDISQVILIRFSKLKNLK